MKVHHRPYPHLPKEEEVDKVCSLIAEHKKVDKKVHP
jgi:hypothetical protein